MPFESKDVRAVYDSLTVDPLFRNLNKPYQTEFTPIVTRSRSGWRQEELDAYKESRKRRLAEMYKQ
jgi:hypothetical protein